MVQYANLFAMFIGWLVIALATALCVATGSLYVIGEIARSLGYFGALVQFITDREKRNAAIREAERNGLSAAARSRKGWRA